MKKIFTIAAIAALTLSACDNGQQNDKTAEKNTVKNELKIAYVVADSLTTQYKFAKDFTAVLEKKQKNSEATLNAKGQALQSAVQNFQQKLQQNEYTRERAEQVQRSLQKQEQDLNILQQRLAAELQNEQIKYMKAFQDSVRNFLKDYNKSKKYDLILDKSAILEGNDTYDITKDVINGLNKRYKPAKETKEK
ncbi:MAG: OmpH family outer membrane protein [Prevotella sp.]|nr:OmpH family outer membrane protein [Candidatus Equicola stercoris]